MGSGIRTEKFKAITINSFFWSCVEWSETRNLVEYEGWISKIDKKHSLVITKVPNKTFEGFIIDTKTGERTELNSYVSGISNMISVANRVLQQKVNL